MNATMIRNAHSFASCNGIEIPESVEADAARVEQIGAAAFAAECLNGDEGPGYEEGIREYAEMLIGAYDADEIRAQAADDAETFGRECAS
jgi:hypothetical protein